METLNFECRGKWFKVNNEGHITQIDGNFSDQWQFLGVSFHHWKNSTDINFPEIWKNPQIALKGRVWDMDHGTVRIWSGSYAGGLPRITKIYKTKEA